VADVYKLTMTSARHLSDIRGITIPIVPVQKDSNLEFGTFLAFTPYWKNIVADDCMSSLNISYSLALTGTRHVCLDPKMLLITIYSMLIDIQLEYNPSLSFIQVHSQPDFWVI
jgi:hypothetical protein